MKLKLLMIEDQDYKVNQVKEVLLPAGHELDVAHSYVSGVRKALDTDYDGIILDMGLPLRDDERAYAEDNGLMVLHELERLKNHTPVLVYSTYQADYGKFKQVRGHLALDSSYSITKPLMAFIHSLQMITKENAAERFSKMAVGTCVSNIDVRELVSAIHNNEQDLWENGLAEAIDDFSMYQLQILPLDSLESTDEGTCRVELDEDLIHEYQELPPCLYPLVIDRYDDGSYHTIDGYHRKKVARLHGQTEVRALVGMERFQN